MAELRGGAVRDGGTRREDPHKLYRWPTGELSTAEYVKAFEQLNHLQHVKPAPRLTYLVALARELRKAA